MRFPLLAFFGALLALAGEIQCRAKEPVDQDYIKNLPVIEEFEYVNSNGELVFHRRHPELDHRGKRSICRCTCRRTPKGEKYHCCKCPYSGGGCFPAVATVRSPAGDVIQMVNLHRGQIILTSYGGKIVQTKVVAFMKRKPEQLLNCLKIRTSTGHVLSLSPDHVVFASKHNDTRTILARFSGDIEVGDFIFVSKEESASGQKLVPSQVTSVVSLVMQGVYLPLTEHGTLIVDGVYTSSYTAFNHHLAHVLMSPMRWFPWLFAPTPLTTGIRTYVHCLKVVGRWIVPSGYQDKRSKNTTSQRSRNKVNSCNLSPSNILTMKASVYNSDICK